MCIDTYTYNIIYVHCLPKAAQCLTQAIKKNPPGIPDPQALGQMAPWLLHFCYSWPGGHARPVDVEAVLVRVHSKVQLFDTTDSKNQGYLKWLEDSLRIVTCGLRQDAPRSGGIPVQLAGGR